MKKQYVYRQAAGVLLAAWMLLGSMTGCGQPAAQGHLSAAEEPTEPVAVDVTAMDVLVFEVS